MALTAEQKHEQAIADAKVKTAELELERARLDAQRDQARHERDQGVEGEAQRKRKEAEAAEQSAADKATREEADKALLVPLGLDVAGNRVLGRFDGEYEAADGSVRVLRLPRDSTVFELEVQARKIKPGQGGSHPQFVYKSVATSRAYLALSRHTVEGLVDETDDLADEVSQLAAPLRDDAAPEGEAAEDAGGVAAGNEDEADREQRAEALENVADRIVQLGDYLRRVRNTLKALDKHVVHRLEHFLTLKAFPQTADRKENIRLLLQATTIPEDEPADLADCRVAREAAYVKKANYKIAEDEFSRGK